MIILSRWVEQMHILSPKLLKNRVFTLKSLRFQHFRAVPKRAKKVVKMVENVQKENAIVLMDSKEIYVRNNSIEQNQKFKKH